VPQENGQKKEIQKCLTYMLSGIARAEVCPPTFPTLEHGLSATPETARLAPA
jgi:hypothetical protein